MRGLAEAFTCGDAAEIASLFTAEAEYVDSGGTMLGSITLTDERTL